MITESFGFFLYTLISIFVIVDPISGVVTFISLTSEMTGEEKIKLQKKAVTLACIIAFFCSYGKLDT